MTAAPDPRSEKILAAIELDRRRDRFIRRVSVTAWSVTFFLLLLLGVLVAAAEMQFIKAALAGTLPWMTVIGPAMPLIIVVGVVSLLIATLSTVGIFLRMRTTTLSEIQQRLAALEEVLASRGDAR